MLLYPHRWIFTTQHFWLLSALRYRLFTPVRTPGLNLSHIYIQQISRLQKSVFLNYCYLTKCSLTTYCMFIYFFYSIYSCSTFPNLTIVLLYFVLRSWVDKNVDAQFVSPSVIELWSGGSYFGPPGVWNLKPDSCFK